MNKLCFAASAAVAMICVLALYRPVIAAPAAAAAADTGGALEEIVVTAEKRESTVQQTAISMTALSGNQLEQQGTQTIQQLIQTLPGVSIRTAGPGQTEFEMRGLGSSGGSTASVGFYLDESPLAASAVALNGRTVIDPDLFDLNHAEVLRGPQGTLYGAGSMGGTIKLVTNPPKLGAFEGATSANVSQTTGGSTNGGANLMLNFPIGDRAALRVVGTGKYISGWIDRKVVPAFPFPVNFGGCGPFYFCTRSEVASLTPSKVIKGSNLERFVSARASLLVNPTQNLSITTSLMYQRIDAEGYNNYQAPPGTSGYAIYQPYDIKEPYYDSFKLASLKITYDLSFAQLTSATSYWKRDVIQTTDSTEALQNIFNLTTFIGNLYTEEDPTTQVSEELRLTSTGTGPFQWVAGVFATNLHSGYITTNQALGFATAAACPVPTSGGSCAPGQDYNPNAGGAAANPTGIVFNDNNPNVTKQSAVFGEATYQLNPELKLTAGLRFYKFKVSNDSNQRGLGTANGNATPTIASAAGSGTGVLPKLNLSYTPTPDLNVYATISKGARPGGVNLPIPLNPAGFYFCGPGSGPSYLNSQPAYYGPDNIWSVELGEKAKFADRRITVNADVFYVKWTDIQQLIVLSCGYPYNTNVGSAKSYGPELEVAAKLSDALTANLTAAYTQAYINSPVTIPGLPISPGTRVTNIPKYTGSLSLDYETMLPGELRLTARIADSYVGPVEDVAYYRETLSPYNLVDFRAGVGRSTWTAFVFGTNLTNKHAALTIDNTVFAWQQPTITRVSTNQPRTIGVELQMKF